MKKHTYQSIDNVPLIIDWFYEFEEGYYLKNTCKMVSKSKIGFISISLPQAIFMLSALFIMPINK